MRAEPLLFAAVTAQNFRRVSGKLVAPAELSSALTDNFADKGTE